MTIKHISFDVWNTLVSANERYSYERSEIISYFAGGISPREAGEAYQQVKKALDADAENMICGDQYYAWYMLGEYLGMLRKEVDIMKKYCEMSFLACPPKLNQDLLYNLIRLSSNYEISIKSNTNFISGYILAESVGFNRMPFLAFMHFSDQWQMCKPDKRFFEQTLLRSYNRHLEADEVLHVGDSKIFDGACVDIGMNFCKVENPDDLLTKILNGELLNA